MWRQLVQYSPSAMTFTSLSTRTGTPGVAVGEGGGDAHAVPARHDRRADGPAGGELDRAGQADADAADVGRAAADLGQQLGEAVVQPGQHDLGPAGDVHLGGLLDQRASQSRSLTASRQWVAPRSAHRTTPLAASKASWVGGRPPVEGPPPCSTSRPEPEQGVDPLGHGGAGQPGGAGQVGAAGGLAVPDELEQDPGREDVRADVPRETPCRGS